MTVRKLNDSVRIVEVEADSLASALSLLAKESRKVNRVQTNYVINVIVDYDGDRDTWIGQLFYGVDNE